LAALLLLTIGCGASDTPVQTADPAVSFVWHSLLGRDDSPPPVLYVDGSACGEGTSYKAIPWIIDGKVRCIGGIYTWGTVFVVRVDGSLSKSALAHELLHPMLERAIGTMDPGHARQEWAIVPWMNEELKAAGH
jgi:hypothetical protein